MSTPIGEYILTRVLYKCFNLLGIVRSKRVPELELCSATHTKYCQII